MNKPAEFNNKIKKPVSIFQADKKATTASELNDLLKDRDREEKKKNQKNKDFLFPVKTLFA